MIAQYKTIQIKTALDPFNLETQERPMSTRTIHIVHVVVHPESEATFLEVFIWPKTVISPKKVSAIGGAFRDKEAQSVEKNGLRGVCILSSKFPFTLAIYEAWIIAWTIC